MDAAHSILPPSSAHVWVECPGSVLMATLYPQPETEDTREGEAVHWICSESLLSYMDKDTSIKRPSNFLGSEAPNGVIITDEMVDGAATYVEEVLSVCQEYGLLSKLKVEQQLAIPYIHEQQFGTPDAYADTDHQLFQWDFKYGHRDVEANSWQNRNYAAGIVDPSVPDKPVRMSIVQPRCYSANGPIKVHQTTVGELRGSWNQLIESARIALGPTPPTKSGKHCRDCPGRHTCPTAKRAAYDAVDYVGMAIPEPLTDEGVSFELAMLERASDAISARYEAVREEAIQRMDAGSSIPGFGIKHGQGNRRWAATRDEVVGLASVMFGIDEGVTEEKLITPAQLENKIKQVNRERKERGEERIDPGVISNYITRSDNGLKLVRSEDTIAAKAFSRQQQE